ncbi:MAG: ATP-binding cassette domain-containing protein, partial [Lentisphaeria bacterium]
MLSFETLTKRFSQGVAILDSVSCRINRGEHVGLVGPNGAGKSTLLAIITGQLEPDSGEMHIRKDARLGFLRQETDFKCDLNTSVIDYCLANFHEIAAIEHQMHELEVKLAEGDSDPKLLNTLSELQHKFELSGGYTLQHELERCLSGLGFKVSDFHRPFRSFSGGWQMRAELARILVTNPDLLLLDEPTNYLDVEAVEWLQEYLRRFEGTLILISHDRFLLNALTDHTIVLMHGQMRKFKGN